MLKLTFCIIRARRMTENFAKTRSKRPNNRFSLTFEATNNVFKVFCFKKAAAVLTIVHYCVEYKM